jgi:uncharacterized protein YjgD (DUF1641 family)
MTLTISKIPKKYKPKYDRLEGLSNRQDELDKLANLYNKTKDKKYFDEWYKLIKQIVRQI